MCRQALHDLALHDLALHDPALHDPALHDPALHDPALHDPALMHTARQLPVPGTGHFATHLLRGTRRPTARAARL